MKTPDAEGEHDPEEPVGCDENEEKDRGLAGEDGYKASHLAHDALLLKYKHKFVKTKQHNKTITAEYIFLIING